MEQFSLFSKVEVDIIYDDPKVWVICVQIKTWNHYNKLNPNFYGPYNWYHLRNMLNMKQLQIGGIQSDSDMHLSQSWRWSI